FASSAHVGRALLVAVVERLFTRAVVLRTGEVRVVLPELFLRRGDHAIVVLGVLVVILRRDRITRGQRVTRELDVFLRNVGRIAANFHIRAVRFVYPRHRFGIFGGG